MRALLDVNVLIALLDAAHIHHRVAHAWLKRELRHGWASCPITLNGCIRIMSQPGYPGALRAPDVAARLGEATAGPAHAFWPDDIQPLAEEILQWDRILGHRQVTDAYLLALAVRHDGRFVTFDRRIGTSVVHGAGAQHLVTLT
ncbi:MAG: TA system VapC family ribonuclease toxin [Candidatus Competibacterales bacterium]|nr:TA system VapC family ribonuclease toxin [Candidatus Competibacterales bacterium]